MRVVTEWPTIGETLTVEGSFTATGAQTNLATVNFVKDLNARTIVIYQETAAFAARGIFGRWVYSTEMQAPAEPAVYRLEASVNGVRVAHSQVRITARPPWRAFSESPMAASNQQVAQRGGSVLADRAPELLVEAVQEKHLPNLYAATQSLATAGAGESAAPLIAPLVGDQDGTICELAVLALGELGPAAPGALPAIVPALDDELPAVRLNAARGVWKVGGDAATAAPVLVELLETADSHVRRQAARALGEMGPAAKSAVPALTQSLNDDDVREAAYQALGNIGADAAGAVGALVDLLKQPQTDENYIPRELGDALALGRIGPPAAAAIPSLARALADGDDEYRLCVLYALGAIGPDAMTAAPALIALQVDDNPDIRQAANDALMSIKPPEKSKPE